MNQVSLARFDSARAAFLLLLLAAFAMPQPLLAQDFDAPAHEFSDLNITVNEDERVRVIVELSTTIQPEHSFRSQAGVQSQRRAIAQRQEDVLTELSPHTVDVIATWKTIPFMAVAVDADGLAALRQSPQVVGIQEDRLDFPLLNGATVHIGATKAWEAGYDGSGQMVVVIDSGIDKRHPFFGDRVVEEACFSGNHDAYPDAPPPESGMVSLCPSGQTKQIGPGSADALAPECLVGLDGRSRCWHGTAVAGIASGANPGDQNFSGVARGSEVAAIQVFTHFMTTSACGASADCIGSYTSDQINALEYVLTELHPNHAIAAVNMSLGGSHFSDQALCDQYNAGRKAIIDNLRAVGIPTIIAAGNSSKRDAIASPACISSAIAVSASVDPTDVLSSFASIDEMVELVAPGTKVLAPVPTVYSFDYISVNGSSFSAPHVAGAWALLKELDPEASIDEILSRLQSTGLPITDTRSGGIVTKPRIDLCAALTDMGVVGGVELSAKVFLQAGFRDIDAGIGLIDGTVMHDRLRALEASSGFQGTYLPHREPYSAQFGIGGSETISDPSLLFADHGVDSIVDWLYLELRDPASPATVLTTRAALLQRDGDVVDVDGVSPVLFDCAMPGNYHVAVRHRNHLGTMTAAPIVLAANGTAVDFTDPSADFWHNDASYDGYEQARHNGQSMLWAGNANLDNSICTGAVDNDSTTVDNFVLTAPSNAFGSLGYRHFGYHCEDVDMDGKVAADGVGNEHTFIFSNVLMHPANTEGSPAFALEEQLAVPGS